MPAERVERAARKLWVVVRAGDAGDYHEFESLAEAAEYLRDVAKLGMPAALTGDMKVEGPGYGGQNYISLYWGTDIETPIRSVTPAEWLKMVDVICG